MKSVKGTQIELRISVKHINSLIYDDQIIAKPADKGTVIVVRSKDD